MDPLEQELLYQKYLEENPDLVKNQKISRLLGVTPLIKRFEHRIEYGFQDYLLGGLRTYLPSFNQAFNYEIPYDYTIGDFEIGKYALNPAIPIKLNLTKLSGHMAIPGATGTGKTNLNMIILDSIQKLYPTTSLRFIIFASKKGCEQRNNIINNAAGSAFFLDKKNLALNCFSPIPRVDYNLVVADLARVISSELGLMVGGQLYLQKNLIDFLSKYRDGNLLDFTEWLAAKKESSFDYRGYRDRLVVRLESVLYEIGEIFKCHKGIEDRTFVTENLVIEIPCSSSFIMSLVSGIILGRMFRFKAENSEYLRYKNLIVLEDAQASVMNQ